MPCTLVSSQLSSAVVIHQHTASMSSISTLHRCHPSARCIDVIRITGSDGPDDGVVGRRNALYRISGPARIMPAIDKVRQCAVTKPQEQLFRILTIRFEVIGHVVSSSFLVSALRHVLAEIVFLPGKHSIDFLDFK